jgi:hypothetical protein
MSTTPRYSRLDPGKRREQILDSANALFAERWLRRFRSRTSRALPGVTRGLVHQDRVADLRRRAVALLIAHHANDTPRLRYALECWTGLNRAATGRWLQGEATREATLENTRLYARARPTHLRHPTQSQAGAPDVGVH